MNNDPAELERRAVLEGALRAIESLQAKLAAAEARHGEPIAIVGLGCRFPGGANSPATYWQLLREGVDAVGEASIARRSLVAEHAGDLPPAWPGGFLEGIDNFEPQFFGISPREAAYIDPQHRLLLEVAWEALEHAGAPPAALRGSKVGVFTGITTNEYYLRQLRGASEGAVDPYLITGNMLNGAPGRIAFTLGLHGPALAVDTACSSSLVAVHLACASLRARECEAALAGGVNVVLSPRTAATFDAWSMMARDGRCKTFDDAADGFVRSEGCGLVVLKRYSDAVAAGDRVLAVIRGSAMNQDGASAGFTVPNGIAQQAVLRQALANSGCSPHEISYVEAHGSGTPLGDPIEVESLAAIYAADRPHHAPLRIGSVKSNLGHLESAAGIAGLIKVVLALQHGEMPRHLHYETPSGRIPWHEFAVVVNA